MNYWGLFIRKFVKSFPALSKCPSSTRPWTNSIGLSSMNLILMSKYLMPLSSCSINDIDWVFQRHGKMWAYHFAQCAAESWVPGMESLLSGVSSGNFEHHIDGRIYRIMIIWQIIVKSQILDERASFAFLLGFEQCKTAGHRQVSSVCPVAIHLHNVVFILSTQKLLTKPCYAPTIQVSMISITDRHCQVAYLGVKDVLGSWLDHDLALFSLHCCEICFTVGKNHDPTCR